MKKLITAFICISLLAGCKKTDDGNGNTNVAVVPSSPTDLKVNVISSTQVDLSWTDKSTNEDGFKIQRKTGTGNFADVGTVSKGVTNYRDNGLTDNTTYTYRVYAYNNVGASLTFTDEVTVTTKRNITVANLTTTAILSITQTTATGGGNIISDGGAEVTARGIVWSTSANPTVSLTTKTTDGTGIGSFTSNITGLTPNTTYYVRAYATNSKGIAYGNEVNFKTSLVPQPTGSVTDIDGNIYPTIPIGTQVWMVENLRTTKYRDGTDIPLVTDKTKWANNFSNGSSLQQPMMCWYDNDRVTNTADKFGALYNWYAISSTTNGNKNVCPTGWHVPSDDEWTTLITFLGGESVAGGKMKSTGTRSWAIPNRDATNSSGFSGLPGGIRDYYGDFAVKSIYGYWWSSTDYHPLFAWRQNLYRDLGRVERGGAHKWLGFSVRCLKD